MFQPGSKSWQCFLRLSPEKGRVLLVLRHGGAKGDRSKGASSRRQSIFERRIPAKVATTVHHRRVHEHPQLGKESLSLSP